MSFFDSLFNVLSNFLRRFIKFECFNCRIDDCFNLGVAVDLIFNNNGLSRLEVLGDGHLVNNDGFVVFVLEDYDLLDFTFLGHVLNLVFGSLRNNLFSNTGHRCAVFESTIGAVNNFNQNWFSLLTVNGKDSVDGFFGFDNRNIISDDLHVDLFDFLGFSVEDVLLLLDSFRSFSDQNIVNIFITDSQFNSLDGLLSKSGFFFKVLSQDCSFRDSVDNFGEVVGDNDIISIFVGLLFIVERFDGG